MDLVAGPLGNVIIKLGKLLKEEYDLQTGVRKKIMRLSRDLESMHAALRKVADVPPEQLDDEVKLWACDIRELSYDIEDILDTFFLVRVEDRDPNNLKRAAKKIGKLFSKSKAHHQIGGMIKTIDQQAEVVAERHRRYRAEDIVSKPAPPRTIDPRLKAMYTDVTQLVGIEKPSDELISMLWPLGGDGVKMVSIVGAGGLGKTTLAKTVYDKVKVNFDCTAFVPVGRDPDLKKVFRDILIGLDKDKYMDPRFTILDERQLIDEIREYLENKRYFVVIDDIWKTDTWKIIEYALVQNNNGSRLITTTRHYDVADQAGAVYKLEPLPVDQSEKLFYKRIFGADGKRFNYQLKEVSNKIINKCHGVPLAIITMASLLVGKTTGEWIEVCNCIVFRDKKQNPQVSDTEWILSLSYYDLPPHLKTCLLYISVFPEDYVIPKYPLIWKWVAEGFVHKEPGTRLFEIGEGYFNELINRSMIQTVVESEKKGIITGCRIHDMVLDLLRVKSQDENFVSIVSGDNEDISLPKRVRRLAHQNRKVVLDHEDAQADLRHVRTFIAIASWNDTLSFPSFQLLRVLALEDFVGWDRICLNHIQNLLHLRYLGLRGTAICELPEGIGALEFLQTLDLERTNVKEFPSSLGLLTQLICLRARQDRRMLVTDGLIEKLTSLEELRGITLGQFVKDLGNLHELRVLEIYLGSSFEELDGSMSIESESELVVSLGNLHKIQHVSLDGYITKPDKAIWDAALLPRSLQCLNLSHICFSLMPLCINPSVLLNLTHLDLHVQRMDEQSLRNLGKLPELRDLKLSVWSTITIIIRASEDGCCFQKLVSLTIPGAAILFLLNEDSTISFTIWYFTDDVAFDSEKRDECIVRAPTVMPNLQLLDFQVGVQTFIRNMGSSDRLGLEYLPSLRKVKVELWCSNAFVDEVEKEEAALRHTIEAHPNRPTLEMHREGRIKTRSRPATHDLEIEEDEEDVGSSMDNEDVATRSRGGGH